jgi:hypothetical protein
LRFHDADPAYDSVTFLDERFLLVTWARREGTPLGPRRMHLVLLDSSTGRVSGSKDWLLPLRTMGLRAADGIFIVRENDLLTAYSSQLAPIAQFRLQLNRMPGEVWRVHVSVDRKHVGLAHTTPEGTALHWLTGAELSAVQSWTTPEELLGAAANHHSTLAFSTTSVVATSRQLGKRGCQIRVLSKSKPPEIVAEIEDSCYSGAQFLTDEILISPGPRWTLRKVTGEVIHQHELGRDEHAWAARVSANGRRAAVPISKQIGGIQILDISRREELQRIMVYDVREQEWIFILDKKNNDLKHVAGFALSPSGESLAILQGSAVELYTLPRIK